MSGQGGIGELSDLPRGCGSGGGGGGMQGEMELGPTQGDCLMGAGEMDEPLSAHLSRKTAIMSQFESKALGLDKAILHSIDCCGKEGQRVMGRKHQVVTQSSLKEMVKKFQYDE